MNNNNTNFVYSNSPNHYSDTRQHEQGIYVQLPNATTYTPQPHTPQPHTPHTPQPHTQQPHTLQPHLRSSVASSIPVGSAIPANNVNTLGYTHYNFLYDYFNKYYNGKTLDPVIVLHLTKVIELSLESVQDVSGLLSKYKEYFKL